MHQPVPAFTERQAQAHGVCALVESDLTLARAQAERFRENLQSLEGRRQVFDSLLGDREALISERSQRVAALEREVAERISLHAEREQDLLGKNKLEQQRVATLEAQALSMRAPSTGTAAGGRAGGGKEPRSSGTSRWKRSCARRRRTSASYARSWRRCARHWNSAKR